MRTLDESVDSIAEASHHDEPVAMIRKVQCEFHAEVLNNVFLQNVARALSDLHMEAYTVADLHHALYSMYMNGVTLGVSIGVRMEKAE